MSYTVGCGSTGYAGSRYSGDGAQFGPWENLAIAKLRDSSSQKVSEKATLDGQSNVPGALASRAREMGSQDSLVPPVDQFHLAVGDPEKVCQ